MQIHHQESGKTFKEFLRELGVGYSTYNYWRTKHLEREEPRELAPISLRESVHPSCEASSFCSELHTGTTLLFLNGLRAHFGTGTDSLMMNLLEKSLGGHVQP